MNPCCKKPNINLQGSVHRARWYYYVARSVTNAKELNFFPRGQRVNFHPTGGTFTKINKFQLNLNKAGETRGQKKL